MILYLLCLGIFFFSKRYTLDRTAEIVNSVLTQVRHRLADKVRLTELSTLEKYGTATVYARMTQDATTISNMSTLIINGAQGLVMIFFTLLYIASLSLWSFVLIALGLAFGMFYYVGHAETVRVMWQEISAKDTLFFEKLGHILEGFNEININRRKNEDVFKAFSKVNQESRVYRTTMAQHYNITLIFTEILFYLLLGIILFVLPKLHAEHTVVITKVVTSVMFIIGPLEGIIFSIPGFANSNNSARNIMELEAQLEEDLKTLREQHLDRYSPAAYEQLPFEHQMEAKGLCYQYPTKSGNGPGFRVGPIDLTVRKGELIFVTGGNGSGKSTFLKLLTGLYKPFEGHIELDGGEGRRGRTVDAQHYQQYQNLFSVIFSDYHLFDKIYGVEREIDPAEVKALLAGMEISEDKTSYKNGAFTNIRLSSGQKKRLALITVLLEDKPIYIFDEVASDLDPAFRDKFYFDILRELKSGGKTVFVVSHDQQYWRAADRLIQFRDGAMHELTKEEVVSLAAITLKQD